MSLRAFSPELVRAIEAGELELTPDERAEGWHLCWDWDGMLVHPDTPEGQCCTCFPKKPA